MQIPIAAESARTGVVGMDTVRLLRQLCDSVGAGAAGAPLRTEKQQEDLLQYALRLLSRCALARRFSVTIQVDG